MNQILPLLFLLLLSAYQLPAQQRLTKQQEKNLVAFAHLYGYVQYFHPSDEAQQVNWRMFSLKGSKQMLAAKDDQELIQRLKELFQPLGPAIQIFPTSQPRKFDLAALQPPTPGLATRVVSWQHQGLRTGGGPYGPGFDNVRLNRPVKETSTITFLRDIDISRFAGQPYEVVVTISSQEDSRAFTLDLTTTQALGDVDNPRATQQLTWQQRPQQSQVHTFTGTFAAAARTLDFTLVLPTAIRNGAVKLQLNAEVLVTVAGQQVRLPLTTGKGSWPTKQNLALTLRSNDLLAIPLYPEQLHLGDYISQEIAPGISCHIPLALAGNASHTYPVGDSLRLRQLHVQLSDWTAYPAEWGLYEGADQLGRPEVRVSNIVNAWNCLRHGYAYWSSASAAPEELLRPAFRRAYQDSTYAGFYHTLQLLLAPLNDGHGFVTSTKSPPSFGVPLAVGTADNQVVVTRVLDTTLAPQVRAGDLVMAIDGVPARKVLQRRASLVSGSAQNKEVRALTQVLNSPVFQPLDLKLRRGRATWHLRLPRGANPPAPLAKRTDKWLAPGIYYYDLATSGKPFLPQRYDTLARAKAIIFDLRGYPGEGVLDLVRMLLSKPAEATLFYNLDMLRPDQEEMRLSPNVVQYVPDPHHLAGKMFFLTDASTQSYPETILALIRAFKLGTLVGRPTSGANGNINSYALQGGFAISYSGLYTLNADGSRHHAIGIQPDVLVMPTLESVRAEQDLILETALKLASSSN